ncbi:MAG: PLP-dependent aminotransferase family protein [Hyphomicrobiaceae bacterium]
MVDLGLVVRPPIADEALIDEAGRKTLRALGNSWQLLSLGEHVTERGELRHRKAAQTWLSRRGISTSDDTVAFMIGAQEALATSLMATTQHGDTILGESTTLAALRDLAKRLGLKLSGVAMDEQGIVPDDLRHQCRRRQAKVLVVQPTLHIPTAARMGADRRRQIADILRGEGLTAIEYEAWSSVVPGLGQPLASLAPERVIHIEGFSNALMPGLRASVVCAPEELMPLMQAARLPIVVSTPRLVSEVASHWIMSGIAARLAAAVARKNESRMRIARRILGSKVRNAPDNSPFVWLPASPFEDGRDYVRVAEQHGVRVLPAERFATTSPVPAFVRVAISSAADDQELEFALAILAERVGSHPARRRTTSKGAK